MLSAPLARLVEGLRQVYSTVFTWMEFSRKAMQEASGGRLDVVKDALRIPSRIMEVMEPGQLQLVTSKGQASTLDITEHLDMLLTYGVQSSR